MTYGKRLQAAMAAAKVDRKTLAKRLDITVQAVGQVVNGDTKALDATNHTKAFLFLGCDPLWLATGMPPVTPPRLLHASERSPRPYGWPFDAIDYAMVADLPVEKLVQLEGAWLLAASQLGFDLRKKAAA